MVYKNKDGKKIDLEELTWKEARVFLLDHNADLVKIIDSISPGDDYKMYRVRYRFGAKIFDKTESYLPLCDGETISFNDPELPADLKSNLSYDPTTGNPVDIVLKKKAEFYLSIGSGILPYTVMEPGHVFGLARILDFLDMQHNRELHLSPFIWELTSGVRSIFMLPKITENTSHNKLKKRYHLSLAKPDSLQNHWEIFKNIADKQDASWRSEFMFFSNKWFEKLNDPAWMKLYCYFLQSNRLSYDFWRSILSWQITFNAIEQNKNMKYATYTLDTAKHLFAIAVGALPGFRPATDENSAPIKLIQEAYVTDYGLIDYWPVIIEATNYNPTQSAPVYYSLNYPTLIQSDLNAHKGLSIISLLDELQLVVKKYKDGLSNNKLAKETSLYKITETTDFSFYHYETYDYSKIKNVSLLTREDSRFKAKGALGTFSKFAPFLRGCIKISSLK